MRFKPFSLPFDEFLKFFSQDELNRNVVVVSIIEKTSIKNLSPSVHFSKFTDTIEELITQVNDEDKVYKSVCQFDGYFDKEENVVFLNLTGPLNNKHLMKMLSKMEDDLKKNGFLNIWSKIKNSFAQALLFMFSFSHIILFISSNYSPDINIIQLLKVLSYVRPKYQAAVSKVLGNCNEFSEDWVLYGRLCSPRLIFLFEGCPYEISELKDKDEKIFRLKKLEHSLEDQIYLALRKSRLVKNVCSRAFFSIAPNDEFVFVKAETRKENKLYRDLEECFEKQRQSMIGHGAESVSNTSVPSTSYQGNSLSIDSSPVDKLDSLLKDSASSSKSTNQVDSHLMDSISSSRSTSPDIWDLAENLDGPEVPAHCFKDFLMKHIRKAHNEGFSDNMGKYSNLKPFFEVPTLKSWIKAVNCVLSEVDNEKVELNSASYYLEKLLGTELKFSSARCKKVLPLAIAIYQENLPSHYNQVTHEKRVKHAMSVFSHHARGPAQQKYIEQLKEECEKIWKSGRQTCEALSLNKNSCTKPKHSSGVSLNAQQGESEHWSGIQFFSSCNCGAKQGPRQDPFTLRAANFDFYQIIAQECGCIHLEKFVFPIFQPSTSDYKAADLSNPSSHLDVFGNSIQDLQNEFQELNIPSDSLSIGKVWTVDESAHGSEGTMSLPLSALYYDQANNFMLNCYSNNQHEKHLVRQASTTEYLPGMVHLESPVGLLPQFPSWSLLCRGPSSLYSHNLGLHDYPGFITGSSYLLPWDVSFREKDICKSETTEVLKRASDSLHIIAKNTTGSKKNRFSKEFMSVKIFIGIEYECIRGHRFMSSAPGVVLKASGAGVIKEDACKITEGNMPLFLPCPCGKVIAQLMRVHIVTPKAPVFVTIDPKVRPAPLPCPTFTTGEQKPIALTQSAYWILRLPYVYASERKYYSVPNRLKNLKYGELLGPMFGITQATTT
ncbi:unnamed protein product [Nezara viridula]|uniref:Nonsense-mediated mRNA decay factor SMG8 n=1 Tax=Nezara viridula TaxID=85310 RepID=A0A9P0EFX3_NEZVI|nr:unnamed protein product [Nezara viridula]